MTYQTTYSKARASLASLCNRAEADREVILIQRHGPRRCGVDRRQRAFQPDGNSPSTSFARERETPLDRTGARPGANNPTASRGRIAS